MFLFFAEIMVNLVTCMLFWLFWCMYVSQLLFEVFIPKQQQVTEYDSVMTQFLSKAIESQHVDWLVNEYSDIKETNDRIDIKVEEFKVKVAKVEKQVQNKGRKRNSGQLELPLPGAKAQRNNYNKNKSKGEI